MSCLSGGLKLHLTVDECPPLALDERECCPVNTTLSTASTPAVENSSSCSNELSTHLSFSNGIRDLPHKLVQLIRSIVGRARGGSVPVHDAVYDRLVAI